jgi:hypothetical protein
MLKCFTFQSNLVFFAENEEDAWEQLGENLQFDCCESFSVAEERELTEQEQKEFEDETR